MTNLIYDYETLDTDVVTLPVLSIATMRYEPERFTTNPYTFQELLDATKFFKFDVAEQVKTYKRKINLETVAWWEALPAAVRNTQLVPNPGVDQSITNLIGIIKNEAAGVTRVFTRGNTFDPMITTAWAKQLGYPEPHNFWTVRDTRSFIEGLSYGSDIKNSFMPDGLGKKFKKHDPEHDIVVDVLRMQQLIIAIS